MRYLSVCSGIEAASVAWRPLGWTPVAFSEIEPFPSAVLAHYYPDTPNWGDMTKFQEWPDADVDVLVGGTPCQSFSVAGLRKGMADPRGNLALTYLAIAERYRPGWVVWENVPGVLPSNGGRDFGSFLGGLGKLGYGFAYKVCDAQYYGLAQRRRRVFVVGCVGDWRRAAAVLFERESLSGNHAPRRETGKAAPTIPARSTGGCRSEGRVTASHSIAPCLETTSSDYSRADDFTMVAHTLKGEGFDGSEDGTGRGTSLVPVGFAQNQRDEVRTVSVAGALAAQPGVKQQTYVAFNTRQDPCVSGEVANPIGTKDNGHGVAFDLRGREGGAMPEGPHDTANIRAASGGSSRSYVAHPSSVRRLTPVECERLQGFPDGYTAVPYRNKPAADGNRYKALGNSMAVPCMAWIGRRIKAVAEIAEERAA